MEITGVLPQQQESTGQFAVRIFAELHQGITVQESGAIEGQVEAVHDMRVAIRRLRVALSNYAVCLPPADRRRVRERLEKLAQALGEVRDLDVMIEALETARINRPPEDHLAIASVIKRFRARRTRRHRLLVEYLQTDEYQAFKLEFAAPLVSPQAEITLPEKHGQAA